MALLQRLKDKNMNEPRIKSPRAEITKLIKKDDLKELMIRCGALHNHYCPGLAMGVMAAQYAMKIVGEESANVTVNNMSCWVDGIQYISGASLANRSLTLDLTGESTVSILSKENGKGVKLTVKDEFMNRVSKYAPDFPRYRAEIDTPLGKTTEFRNIFKKMAVDAGFGILAEPVNELFTIKII